MVLALLTININCGGGGSSSSSSGSSLVSITVDGGGQSASVKIEKNTLFAQAKMFVRNLIKSDFAIAGIPQGLDKIIFTIAASDMATITKDVLVAGQTSITETFSVPNGNDRYFLVEAKDSSGTVLYRGSTTANLDGTPITLSINMAALDITPPEVSPPEDIALNLTESGFPHPLESDRGWGGGSYPWEIIDGDRLCPKEGASGWACGLAFTGGSASWGGETCGWRQATINLGEPKAFNKVVVWHHGLEHVPNTYKIQYWDGTNWVDIFSTTNGHSYLKYPTDSPQYWWESWSMPTENSFPLVTSGKVRFALYNCDITHGWIYEFEVYIEAVQQYTLTVNKIGTGTGTITSTGINCGSDCTELYNQGTVVALTATAATGSAFTGWSGGGCTGTGTCSTTINANTNVIANFNKNTYAITATAGTGGNISPSGTVTVNEGTNQTFTITANTNYSIANVLVDGSSVGAVSTYTFNNVTAAHTISASFTMNTYSLAVTKTGTGTGTVTSSPAGINCGSDCSEAYNAGTVVTLTAAPDTSSIFTGWSGGGCIGTGTCAVTMDAAKAITATFVYPYPQDLYDKSI